MIKIDIDKKVLEKAESLHWSYFNERIIGLIKHYQELLAELLSLQKLNANEFDARIAEIVKKWGLSKEFLEELTSVLFSNAKIILLYNEIFDFLRNRNKVILLGCPLTLEQTAAEIKTFVEKYLPETKDWQHDWTYNLINPLYNLLGKIYAYDTFVKKKEGEGWDAYCLAEILKVNVCPYCNRQYTFTVVRLVPYKTPNLGLERFTKEKISRPEFDHFCCQSKFPYLAISLYNLIPSCHICNSTLKGKEKLSLSSNIHPYNEGYEDEVLFETGITIDKFITEGFKSKPSIKLTDSFGLDTKKSIRARANIDLFELEAIYDNHLDLAEDIFKCANVYKYANFKGFEELAGETGKLFEGDFDLYRLVFINYWQKKDFLKRPLSKFTRDISKETGFLDTIHELMGVKE